jgi:hypothetical protein
MFINQNNAAAFSNNVAQTNVAVVTVLNIGGHGKDKHDDKDKHRKHGMFGG